MRRRFPSVGIVLGLAVLLTLAGGPPRLGFAADAVGSLAVESDPAGASVYVDGQLVGQTPLVLASLASGDHRVRLSISGHLDNSQVVTVNGGKTVTLRTRLTARAAQNAKATGLTIVVVDGEDAVNIIQQKTAVAPVVEVRDRNNQPVAGAVVRFAIQGGRATFNGTRTLTVTTNVAGRAVVTGLTPTGTGAVQIGVSAAFQGQTAVATIAQTNVLTAAQATAGAAGGAGGTGSGSSAGAGGLGGGFPIVTAGVIGGAAVGGLVVAQKTILGGPDVYTGPVVGDVTYNYRTCTTTTRLDTSLELHLEVADDGSVTGQARYFGTGRDLSTTCGGPLQSYPDFGWTNSDPTVTGTTTSIAFFHNPTLPNFPNTRVIYTFRGALNGDVVTGTLTYEQQVDGFSAGVTTFPMTMNKK